MAKVKAGRTGPKTLYPGKDRGRPVVVSMTPAGHKALERGMRRRRLSRPDYLEQLVREDDAAARAEARARRNVKSLVRAR